MTTNEQEMLELAKKCGATIEQLHVGSHFAVYFSESTQFFAYTSAIEEKYQAQIAMLNILLREATCAPAMPNEWHKKVRKAVTDTQATSDAFIAEVKAGAKLEGKIEALEDAANELADFGSQKPVHEVAPGVLRCMAAELRNQQPDQPRKPCTCDGWCDGFCLTQEGSGK